MCGIAGILQRGSQPVELTRLMAAAKCMRHRGPDDEGYLLIDPGGNQSWCLGGSDTAPGSFTSRFPYAPVPGGTSEEARVRARLGVASRRLAIQDLSPAGHQPMCDSGRNFWIVFNGEVYNFAELRDELTRAGCRFFSGCDTEVILYAWQLWGPRCLDLFNGMWAFALWDARARRLVCARDRFGVKPFYYSWNGERLVFASEPKAILATGLVERAVNDRMLYDYLAWSDFDHQPGETFFAGIRELPAGHWLELDYDAGDPRLSRWYQLPESSARAAAGDQAEHRFAETFLDAVRLRLIADVPVGTCLSGGLDSSAIVGAVTRVRGLEPAGGVQKTFSARYSDPVHDESAYIDAVVAHSRVEAHSVYPTGVGLAGEMERLIWHQDEPFGTTSTYAQWSVFKLAREQGVPVTLDGQGGDEILAGYPHHFLPWLASLARRGEVRAMLREARAGLGPQRPHWLRLAPRIAGELLPFGWRRRVREWLRPAPDWIAPDFARESGEIPAAWPVFGADPFEAVLRRDILIGLRKILRMADRSSMAHSVESRVPFLDYRLVELCLRLRGDQLIRDGATKWILRRAAGDLLPGAVRARRDKIGFSTPEEHWFRGDFSQVLEDLLATSSFRQRPYWSRSGVESTFERWRRGQGVSPSTLWRWVNAELWLEQFLDRPVASLAERAPAG